MRRSLIRLWSGPACIAPFILWRRKNCSTIPLLGWLIRHVNAFPIRRKEGDVGAFRTAQRILAAGRRHASCFPRDAARRAGCLENPKRAWGLLAVKSGAPVVPVYVHNTYPVVAMSRV
jgi:1-acyl-sn-glycerol-3-phosphate acyltransferase